MHTDALGKDILVNNYVAFPQTNKLMVGRVSRLTDKMIMIQAVVKKRVNRRTGEYVETYRKYPKDCVVVDQDSGLTMYVIRNT